jgi:hypothetical protein
MIRQNMQLRLWAYITVNKYAVEFVFVIVTCQFTKLSYTDFNFLIFYTLLLSFLSITFWFPCSNQILALFKFKQIIIHMKNNGYGVYATIKKTLTGWN